MKSREYGTWPPRNVWGPDRQKLYDEHNRSFKRERSPQPNEYASTDIEEYYRVPETKDMSGNPYEKNGSARSSQSQRTKNTRQLQQRVMQQVVGVLAGSVVIVSSYQAMAAERQIVPEPPAVVQTEDQTPDTPQVPEQIETEPVKLSPSWIWSDDKQTVTLELSDADGNKIKEISATVSVSETAATCNKEGLKTYIATAEDEDDQYSDSQSEPIPPLGHSFDGGKETVLENGQTAMTFECTRCHEQFTIQTSMTEND